MSIFPMKILMATDGSEEAERALRVALTLADATGSELHLVTVGEEYHPGYEISEHPSLLEETLQELEQEAQRTLDEQTKKIQEAGGTIAGAYLRRGSRADNEIVRMAEELGAGMIVMGSRGRGRIRRALMGSVSDSVVRHAHCPVLVVRQIRENGEPGLFSTKILLATDGSEEATLAARAAADIARKTGSELHVVYAEPLPLPLDTYIDVVQDMEQIEERARKRAQEFLDEQVERIEAVGGIVAQTHFGPGRPDDESLVLAERIQAGLIVIGSRGWGGIRRALIGSVSDSIVRHAHCPVLVVRREGDR